MGDQPIKIDIAGPGRLAGLEFSGVMAAIMLPDAESYAFDAEDVLGIEAVGWAHLSEGAMVDLATAAQGLVAQVQAVQLTAIDRVCHRRGDAADTTDEFALALAETTHVAGKQISLARQLTSRFPALHAAMRRGELDATKATRVIEAALPLPDELARELDEWMRGRVAGRDATAIGGSARYQVHRLDPDGAERRARRRRRDRKVEFVPNLDGMADLIGYLPAEVASAAYGRIDAIAKSCRTRDDARSLDEVRADVFTELLLGKQQYTKTVQVHVTVPITALLGDDSTPADLAGYGPLPASIARQLAFESSSVWRRLLTDPATGQLLEVGRTRYRPPAALDDFVRARDQRCRIPGCRRPARRCDIDHNHDWRYGGLTNEDLLCCLCRRHHRLKDKPGWTFTLHNNELVITTPAGRTYRSRPPPQPPNPDPPSEPDTTDPPF